MFKKMPMLQEGWDDMLSSGGSSLYPMSENKMKVIKALVHKEALEQAANFVKSPLGQKLLQLNGGPNQLAEAIQSLPFDGKECLAQVTAEVE